MNILGIDTSTGTLSLAILSNGSVIAEENHQLGRSMSNEILPKLLGILESAGLSLSDINGMAVGLGPGSFTSLRIGLATIKGLAFATNIPIVGVPSLDAMAQSLEATEHSICVITDAKRSQVFGCRYSKTADGLKQEIVHMLIPISEFLDLQSKSSIFIGEAVSIYNQEIEHSGKMIKSEIEPDILPQARHILELAFERFEQGNTDTAETLLPLYLYKEDCQVRK